MKENNSRDELRKLLSEYLGLNDLEFVKLHDDFTTGNVDLGNDGFITREYSGL